MNETISTKKHKGVKYMNQIKQGDTVRYKGRLPFLHGELGIVTKVTPPLTIKAGSSPPVVFSSAKLTVEWNDSRHGESGRIDTHEFEVITTKDSNNE